MGKNFDKFLLLIWKNSVLQWRHPIQTAIEILAPLLLASLLIVLRGLVSPEQEPAVLYSPFVNDLTATMQYANEVREFVYSPKSNPALREIVSQTVNSIFKPDDEKSYEVNITGVENGPELEAYLTKINNQLTDTYDWFIIGIQFEDSLSESNKLPEFLNVTLRFPGDINRFGGQTWQTDSLYPFFQSPGPREYYSKTGASPNYYESGFLTIQQQLSYMIIKQLKEQQGGSFDPVSVPVNMQRFPYPTWYSDDLVMILQYNFGVILTLSYLYTCSSTVKSITYEKEKQLKETMKIMGLPSWLHWAAWFIKTFILLLITTIIMVVMLTVGWFSDSNYALFMNSDPIIIFLFSIIFVCATITFCFAISVFFSKANLAAIITGVTWVVTFTPFTLSISTNSLSLFEKLAGSILPNTAMSFGFQVILQYEGTEEGIQWHNIWERVSPDNELVLGYTIIMLIIDTILYLLITIYVEQVFPGDFGVPQKWYFPFSPSYWCGKRQFFDNNGSDDPVKSEYYEKEPTELQVGIQIKQLGKRFSNKTTAVQDLTLNLYKDQITVLLGHNGAGKTTTMSMLTGMFPPTSGTAIVEGYDIRTQMPAVRDSLGLCPQHNILFDDMTVQEHLYFYGRLKGLTKSQIKEETEKFLDLLELKDKGNARSSTLSGGMKRKLSVAIALCGGSSVVMCDEPSSGMDPSARRALWNLLQSQKKGRTILLTTHFMDEADLLGDRIAIMSEGKLQCCGSSYFLKKKYGAGYHLIMDKSSSCDVEQVTKLLQKFVPNIQVESNIGSELSYTLSEEHSGIFQEMLGELERQSNTMGISSYGISLTNFDEVFMKANTIGANKDDLSDNQEHIENNNPHTGRKYSIKPDEIKLDLGSKPLTGRSLWFNQMQAMFMKRALTTLRSWILFLVMICIPIVILLLIILISRVVIVNEEFPNLKISMDPYRDPVTVLVRNPNNEYAEKYINLVNNENTDLIDWEDNNMSDMMLEETKQKLSDVQVRYLTGATFWRNKSITAWFNNNPLHTPPLALQMVMNSILHQQISQKHYLQFNYHPLPPRAEKTDNDFANPGTTQFQISLNLGIAMATVSAFYIIFYVKERASNSKHLQFVSGVRVVIFWGVSYISDLLSYTLICICIIATFAALQEDGFSTAEELGRIFLILFNFGFSILPVTYLASFIARVPSTGFVRMLFLNMLFGVATFLLVNVTSYILKENNIYFIHYILMIVPLYSFCTSIFDVTENSFIHKNCDQRLQNCITFGESDNCENYICGIQEQCCDVKDYFAIAQPGVGTNILYTDMVAIGLFLILLGIEYRFFEKMRYAMCKSRPSPTQTNSLETDHDVQKEKDIIKNASIDEISKYDLAMRNVTKYYSNFLAVNDLCLGVNRYECFGLLGVNGAGKTTTFKMMTGEIPFSSGDAWVAGLNLKTDMKRIHQSIGYCPQFDALLDDLTCRETIVMFSLLRGFTTSESKAIAKKLARDFDFYQHLDKKVKQLSGGNKRKLSTALTLIGDPLILYLDEPTTGMDPATKRYLWRALCKVRDSGKCIILTSHSMEECEALCTRIAIMVNGGFMCLGSTQHLKSKFSEGYTLIIRLRKTDGRYDLEPVEKYVKENFQSASMRENHLELVTFYIPDKTKPWSQMFGIMEHGKKILNIEDYSLGQSSLEQVFLSFTKYQQ